jgi:hypothetical protein
LGPLSARTIGAVIGTQLPKAALAFSFGGMRRRADRDHANHTIGGQKFDPETTRIMDVAFEMARATVKRDWGDLYANHSIAKRIIELAKAGERNPDVLCEQALSYFLRL